MTLILNNILLILIFPKVHIAMNKNNKHLESLEWIKTGASSHDSDVTMQIIQQKIASQLPPASSEGSSTVSPWHLNPRLQVIVTGSKDLLNARVLELSENSDPRLQDNAKKDPNESN